MAAVILAAGIVVGLHERSGAQQTASLTLLRQAADPNPTLQSYTATAQLSAILHVVIPVRKNFGGTVYYLKPKREIHFQNVTGELSRFKDLAATTPTYDEAITQYAITPLTDNGTVSQYSAVPKKQGSRVKSITITVNDAAALVSRAQWSYTNGGTLSFTPTYTNVGTYHLESKTDISARFPDYSVDGTITFSNYKPNAPVSPSVFTSPSP